MEDNVDINEILLGECEISEPQNEGVVDAVNTKCMAEHYINDYDMAPSSEIVKKYPFFRKFFAWVGEFDTLVVCFRDKRDSDRYLIKFFTEKQDYSINLTPEYMGGGVSCRYHRPLEDWTRGNDLLDGKPSEHLLDSLVYEILAYELVEIKK